jgi:hypothetical protein
MPFEKYQYFGLGIALHTMDSETMLKISTLKKSHRTDKLPVQKRRWVFALAGSCALL